LRILFVGINPGLRSAAVGHHFAGHSNRFWKLLFESNLVSEPLRAEEDQRVLQWNLGLTNVIRRPTTGIDLLSAAEYAAGRTRLIRLIDEYQPRLVALLGVTIYRYLFVVEDGRPFRLGLQPDRLSGARIFVLPNPSGRNAHYSYRTMLASFRTLRKAAGAE